MIEKPNTDLIKQRYPKGIFTFSENGDGATILINHSESLSMLLEEYRADYFKLGYTDAATVFEKMRTELELKASAQYRQGIADVLEKIKDLKREDKNVTVVFTDTVVDMKKVESVITNMLYGSKEKES